MIENIRSCWSGFHFCKNAVLQSNDTGVVLILFPGILTRFIQSEVIMKKKIIALTAAFLLAGCQAATTDQTVYTVSDIYEKGNELLSSDTSKKDVHIEGIIEADTLAGENTLAGILVSDETTSYTMYCYFDGPDTRSVYEEKKKAGDSASMTVWLFDGGSKDHPSYYGIIVDLK